MQKLKNDWFPRGLPDGFQMGERGYFDSSYSFLHCDPSAHNIIRIGHDSGIYANTMFELGPHARVEIGNFTALIGAIVRAEREVLIGDYVLISYDVVIIDCESVNASSNGHLGAKRFPVSNCPPLPIRIGDNVWIGFKTIILAGVTVGDGAIIGAGSVVNEDVPPMTVVAGNPARVFKRLEH